MSNKKSNLSKNKVRNFFNNKNVLIIMVIVTILFIVAGITLTIIGYPDYSTFISANDSSNRPDISIFVYGTFFIAMSIVLILMDVLYTNSIFNKKMKTL
ncbi:hypothetical protein [Mycoplasmoides alvi]|uniref:hypothetical protein n=1 Tax=Mycoplasmoides alvi TaxID=78580 RepID=UPI00051ADE46|nr:hypothetical protein [Mycoplasmoides alvi]